MRDIPIRVLTIVSILATILLSGCHDAVDIERRMIVSPTGIDAAPGGRLKATFRMPLVRAVPVEQPTGGHQISLIRTVTARGLVEAALLAQEEEEHALFFGQCRALVIGESLAARGVTPILDAIYRHTMVPPNTYVVVARPTAEQVLKIKWPEVEMHDQNIRLYFEDRRLPCEPLKLWFFIQNVLDDMEDPVVPLVEPSEGGTTMRALGAMVFRGDRAVGQLGCSEAILYQIMKNSPKRAVLTMEAGKKTPISFMQVHGRTMIKADWRDGRPLYTVRVGLSGNLSEYTIRDSLNLASIGRLEKRMASILASGCTDLLRKLRSLKSDPLQLGNRLRIQQPRHFSVRNWPALYEKADFRVAVSFRINDLGKLK